MQDNTTNAVETPEANVTPKVPSQKELFEQRRQTRNFFKEQTENLKPQVEFAELRARLSKATFENYQYGMELNRIETAQAANEKKATEEASSVNNSDLPGTEGASVIDINKNQEAL